MLLFLVGLLAILCQVVLLRELNVAFYGVELLYGIALAAWMAGSAAGAACLPRLLAATRGRLAWLLAVTAFALPAEVALIRASRWLLGGVPGAYLPFDRQAVVLAVSVLPPSFILGLAFRWAAQLSAASGRPLAASYGIESAGAVCGALVATAAFASGVQTFTVALVTGGLAPLVLIAVHRRTLPRVRQWLLTAATLLAVITVSVSLAPRLDLLMTAWSHPTVVETRDSPYARVTATATGSQTALFLDDVLVQESETAMHEELAHVTALQHPAPRRILLLGGTLERIDVELRRHGPERLDVVELDRTYVHVGERQMGLRSTAVFDDPRDFLRRSGQYDLIVVAMPAPTSGQSNRFYTAEFFGECRRHLAPGGVVGFRIELPENVLTPLLALRTASLVFAARSAFPFVDVLHGTSGIALASSTPLPAGADVLARRLEDRGLLTKLVTPAYLRYLYDNDRRLELRERLERVKADANSDARPACYQFAALNWLAKFFPSLVGFDPGLLGTADAWRRAAPWGMAFTFVLFSLARRSNPMRATAIAGVAGLVGALLETVLLLDYQARSGALFERLGVLIMAFMAGLAAGAWTITRSSRNHRGSAGLLAAFGRHPRFLFPDVEDFAQKRRSWRIGTCRGPRATRTLTAGLFVTMGIVGAATAGLIRGGADPGFVGTALLMFVVGTLVAALFGCACVMPGLEDGPAIGRLYGADLAGGAVGSLLAGLVLVPMAGLVPTAWVVVGISLLALLLV